ncbi:site-specific integrase [Mucilaginibacter gossypii]|uniref:Site-specific recombinase XerD n=1 Tax=Mucilaginibacter gossypii TaxID=551996 RepID=A0A1G7ZWE9_9SPHI|nr:site-specific integrase [Mucilaginibacter gossypii]SDH12963.1 Site-specific recombinase XerD [Mucilaginibacter gossypii]
MIKNVAILFYLKKRTNAKEEKVPVYVRITCDGQRAELATGQKIEAKFWNPSEERAKGKTDGVSKLNTELNEVQLRITDTIRYLKDCGEELTAEKIKNRFLGKTEKPIMLIEVFKEHNRKVAALVNQEFAPATVTRYETTLKHTQDFMQWKYKIKDIRVKEIDHRFISEFEFYLRSERKCNNNSAFKYIKNFGKIIRICLASGWITVNPFLNYKIKIKKVDRPFLSKEELEIMAYKEFSSVRLELVRDIFLFSCYTGLAYIDVQTLKRSEVVKGFDGERWIFTSRQKTDTPSRIPLLPYALGVIDKYENHPQCEGENSLLPILSNQKMNAYLKEIADLCGINKDLTFHIARHTFATTVTLLNGVPIESVSKMLGHTNIKTTQHYARILDLKVGEDMGLLRKKLQS